MRHCFYFRKIFIKRLSQWEKLFFSHQHWDLNHMKMNEPNLKDSWELTFKCLLTFSFFVIVWWEKDHSLVFSYYSPLSHGGQGVCVCAHRSVTWQYHLMRVKTSVKVTLSSVAATFNPRQTQAHLCSAQHSSPLLIALHLLTEFLKLAWHSFVCSFG